VGSFSFQQSKTMASGEGGICITNDADIAERIYRIKHIGYGPGQAPGKASSGPPPGVQCYNFRATAFQALILREQLKGLEERLERYRESALYLERRLGESTKIRFQKRGRKADRQSYWQWVMIFDDPSYADIPLSILQKALAAEGVPPSPTWGPVYRFILFNLKPEAYRVPHPCTVAEEVGARILCLIHAYLGLEMDAIEKIADAIEKVMSSASELQRCK
jgi:dTDP-4-amino-4,6-dideoxygalactose transaminase